MTLSRRIAAPVVAVSAVAALFSGVVAPAAGAGVAQVSNTSQAGGQNYPGADIAQARILDGAPADAEEPLWRETVQEKAAEYGADRVREIWTYSPSMDRNIPLVVISPPADMGPRPVLYLLNGGDGGEGRANWVMQTDVVEYYLDKNIHVVIPMEGAFSYYTDWVTEQPQLGGKQNWETYVVKELPRPIEQVLNANGKRAVAGMSMSATTTLIYGQQYPDFYDAIGSYSGCAQTDRDLGRISLDLTLDRAGTNGDAMWGPTGSPNSLRNDALVNASLLGQVDHVYVSNASGTAGRWDVATSPRLADVPDELRFIPMTETILVGGVIEGATNKCTHDLKAKLEAEGINHVDWNFRNTGTHSWGYWQDDMRGSWATYARAFDLENEADSWQYN